MPGKSWITRLPAIGALRRGPAWDLHPAACAPYALFNRNLPPAGDFRPCQGSVQVKSCSAGHSPVNRREKRCQQRRRRSRVASRQEAVPGSEGKERH